MLRFPTEKSFITLSPRQPRVEAELGQDGLDDEIGRIQLLDLFFEASNPMTGYSLVKKVEAQLVVLVLLQNQPKADQLHSF